MNSVITRWNVRPSKNPRRARYAKLVTCIGATSGIRRMSSSPLFVTMRARQLSPGAKVSVSDAPPEESDVALMYSILSRPVIFCSMIWVTLSSTVLAEAPGYMARIEIDGGAIGGYCDTGRL